MSAFEPVRYAALTDVGVKRSHNQDACTAQPAVDEATFRTTGHIFVVADGMGGHAVGEKASAKAVREIPLTYAKHAKEGTANALRRAFIETNAIIHAIGKDNPEFRGLGTTSTALVLRPEGAWVGHVGDSRAYRIRNGVAEQLTFDHSWVWEVARRQGVDPDELGDFKRNVIIRSLGPDPEVEVDIEGPHPVLPGDTFLLCSDGLTGVVTPQEVGAVVTALPPEEAVRLLVHLANLRGGPDNITVLIVRVPGDPDALRRAGAGGPGVFLRAAAALNRLVPWPYIALIGGSLLALASLWLRTTGADGSLALFALAAVVILLGLIGLVRYIRQEPSPAPETNDASVRPLNVYKRADCSITPELVRRFAELEEGLVEGLKSQDVPVDWEAYSRLAAAESEAAGRSDPVPEFQARCRAILFLAEALHRARAKGESFRPNW